MKRFIPPLTSFALERPCPPAGSQGGATIPNTRGCRWHKKVSGTLSSEEKLEYFLQGYVAYRDFAPTFYFSLQIHYNMFRL
jgi:hypothetical protein